MRLSAIDAIQRGLTNLRCNWELILLQMAQGVLLTLLMLAGFVPIVLALGAGFFRSVWTSGGLDWRAGEVPDLALWVQRMAENWPLFVTSVFGALCIWTVAFLMFCWVQAGVLGQLAEGDEQAAGIAAERPTRADFRVFSVRGFSRLANARIWSFFWLINVFVVLGLTVLLIFLLSLSGLVALSVGGDQIPAAIATGCFSALLFVPIWMLLSLWTQLGKAALVSGSERVWQAFRDSFFLLFRRLGAVLLIAVLAFIAAIAVSAVFLPASLAADAFLGSRFSVQLSADVAIMVLQSAVSATVGVAVGAVFVSLVRSEKAPR